MVAVVIMSVMLVVSIMVLGCGRKLVKVMITRMMIVVMMNRIFTFGVTIINIIIIKSCLKNVSV